MHPLTTTIITKITDILYFIKHVYKHYFIYYIERSIIHLQKNKPLHVNQVISFSYSLTLYKILLHNISCLYYNFK